MLIPHVVQTEADKVFVNVLNTQASSVTDGECVVWDITSPNGVRTTQPATGYFNLVVGLVDGTIAASAYGLAQAYGYKASGSVSNNSTTAIVAGDPLTPVTGTDVLGWLSTASGMTYSSVYAAEGVATNSTPAAAAVKVFIKAL